MASSDAQDSSDERASKRRRKDVLDFLDVYAEEAEDEEDVLDWTDDYDGIDDEEVRRNRRETYSTLAEDSHFEKRAVNTPAIFQNIIDLHEQHALGTSVPESRISLDVEDVDPPPPPHLRTSTQDISRFRSHQSPHPSTFLPAQREPFTAEDRSDRVRAALADALKVHPDQRFLSKYPIFHVKCQIGEEDKIIRRIRRDLGMNPRQLRNGDAAMVEMQARLADEDSEDEEELPQAVEEPEEPSSTTPIHRRIILATYRSQVPGFIYLQAANMNTGNHLLASYLRLIPGFAYKNRPRYSFSRSSAPVPLWESPRLELPVHFKVPLPILDATVGLSSNVLYLPGTWVRIREGLYHGDVGRVLNVPDGLPTFQRRVMVVPRLPITKVMLKHISSSKDVRTGKRKATSELRWPALRPDRRLWYFEELEELGRSIKISLTSKCVEDDCTDQSSCLIPEHQLSLFAGQDVYDGMVHVSLNISVLETANSIDYDESAPFFQSGYYTGIPPPSFWIFRKGDRVQATSLSGQVDAHSTVPFPQHFVNSNWVGTIVTEDCPCDVSFSHTKTPLQAEVHAVPPYFLRKLFRPGDSVELHSTKGLVHRRKVQLGVSTNPTTETTVNEDVETGARGLVAATDLSKWTATVVLAGSHDLHEIAVNSLSLVDAFASESSRPTTSSDSIVELARLMGWKEKFRTATSDNASTALQIASNAIGYQELPLFSSTISTTAEAIEYLQKVHLSQLRPLKTPWKGTEVVVIRHSARKGYAAVVRDVRRNDNMRSGLAIFIEYVNPSIRPEWIDFDALRHRDTLHFLHISALNGTPPSQSLRNDMRTYYGFKEGYKPTYTMIDLKAIAARTDKLQHEAAAAAQARLPPRGQTPPAPDVVENPEDVPPAWRVDSPETSTEPVLPSYWIQDSRIAHALKGLSVYVRIYHGAHCNPDLDQKIRFGEKGEIVLCSDGSRISPQDICVAGAVKSDKVAQLPHSARGLYVIVEGSHVGKLCRRVSHIPEESEDRTFLCQEVAVVKEGRGIKQSLVPSELLHLKRHQLLEVHESAEVRKAGNKLVEDIRKQWNGNFRAGGNQTPRR